MIRRSPRPSVEIPDVALADFILDAARKHGDRPALIDGLTGATLTFTAFAGAVTSVAAGLSRRGLRQGDTFGICGPNSIDYAIALFGASAAGLVVTPINAQYGAAELTHQMRDASVKAVVTAETTASKAVPAAQAAGVAHVYAFGEVSGTTPFDTLRVERHRRRAVRVDTRNDAALILYSSATTGSAKGVLATHRNLVTSIILTQAIEQFDSSDTAIAVVPFHHIYGLGCVLNTMLWAGGRVVILPTFDAKQFLRAIQTNRVTTAYVVPPIVRTLAVHPLIEQYDLSSLKQLCSAAAPLPESVAQECASRIGCVVKQAYGLTEACGFIHLDDANAPKPASVGRALPNTEFRIVDVISKQDVADGELGEVWIRGPQVMKGYLHNPEATSQLIDRDGWLHTGDIGYSDEDGALYVMDRAKDLVKFRGLQYRDDELLLSMVEELSERRHANERLQFQALMLENVRESVVAVDEQWRVTYWNRGAETLFGYAADEALGHDIKQLTVLADEGAASQWAEELATLDRDGHWKGQARRRRKDGSVLWIDIVVAPVIGHGGSQAGWLALHRDITELRHNQEMLEKSNQRLQNLAGRLMDIREQERASIARELHDELGQSLTRLNMDLRWLIEQLPGRLQVQRVAEMVPLVDSMLNTVQHLSFRLRPAILDDLGLDAAIEWQAEEFQHWNGCRCKVELKISELPPDRARGIVVFRILQESLTNVARHARAKGVWIRGLIEDGQLTLQIRDDGVGIPTDAVTNARSLGLLGMRERARSVGGHVDIERLRPRGTRVTVRIPIERVDEPLRAAHGVAKLPS